MEVLECDFSRNSMSSLVCRGEGGEEGGEREGGEEGGGGV